MNNNNQFPMELLLSIRNSRKYQSLEIPIETLTSLFLQETKKVKSDKMALLNLKAKLHNIVAPYLDTLDYDLAKNWIDDLKPGLNNTDLIPTCLQILRAHASTRERIDCLPDFFDKIFMITGKPRTILDLACGLNPFFFPWMGLDRKVRYDAIDLHKARIDLIKRFFQKINLQASAIHDDFLVNPPLTHSDVVFLFKEVHRLEQRQKGCSLRLWNMLNTDWLVISLPTQNLAGTHSLLEKHRQLIKMIITGSAWKMAEILFTNEVVFCLNKS